MSDRKKRATPVGSELETTALLKDWTTLDAVEPLTSLRKVAGLSLAGAARASRLKCHSTIEMAERREGRDGGSVRIGTLAQRARDWGYEVRIQVRRSPR